MIKQTYTVLCRVFLLSKWDEDGEARVPETRRSRYRVRARYRERHTNNATEMSPYDSLLSSFCSFTFVRCIFPQSSGCSGTNRKSPVNSGGLRTISQRRKNPPTTGKRFEILSVPIVHIDVASDFLSSKNHHPN